MKKTTKEQIKMATIINGKEVSAKVKEQVAEEVKQLKEKIAHTMEPLLKDVVPQESSFDIWRMLNNSVKV